MRNLKSKLPDLKKTELLACNWKIVNLLMEEKKFATLFSFERNKDDQDLQLILDGVGGLRHPCLQEE